MSDVGLDLILNQTFSFVKQIAKDWYFAWTKNPPRCPAFGGEVVHITREGWEHITHKEGRTKTDIMGRSFMLERTRKLLEESNTFQDYLERSHEQHGHEFWIFEGIVAA